MTMAGLLALGATAGVVRGSEVVDAFVAKVNSRVVTMGDVLDLIQPTVLQLRDAFAGDELKRRREDAYEAGVEELIGQALILEEFAKKGGALPDRLVDDRINEVIFERFDGDRAAFFTTLAEEGITLEEWRTRVRERLTVDLLRQQEVNDRLKISPAAIREAYEKQRAAYEVPETVRLRQLTLRETGEEPSALARAGQLRERVRAGEAFAALAEEHSKDRFKDKGGDRGPVAPSDLAPVFRDAIASLGPGQVSEPLVVEGSVFLLFVEERQTGRTRSLEEVRGEIERELRRSEGERLYKAWIERLKTRHAVTIY